MMRIVPCLETHTCGEPTRFVIGGLFNLPGESMVAKQAYVRHHHDALRKALVREPRGHRGMFGAILTAPVSLDAVCGVIWFDNQGYLSACGHGSIGLGVAMLEAGMVAADTAGAGFVVDSPAGPFRVRVTLDGRRARDVTFENVPAFSCASNVTVAVPGLGAVTMDIAFGGNFFGIVDAAQVGLELRIGAVSALGDVGFELRDAVNRQVQVHHPALDDLDRVDIITFRAPPTTPGHDFLVTHMFGDRAIDRSPGGTGLCALMAALHAQHRLAIGEELVVEGIAAGSFRGRLLRTVALGDRLAAIPAVTGTAFVTGYHQFILDSDDPWIDGFEVR